MVQEPHLVMFDSVYLRKYICPNSNKILDILEGFRQFYDELIKYKEEIFSALDNEPYILNMNVNNYNL